MCGKSIIEQVQAEKEQRARDEAKRPELRGRLENWRSRGYNVSGLAALVEGDVPAAEASLSDFEKGVRRLSEVQLKLNSLDVMGFPGEVAAIRQRLNDPDAAGALEEQVTELEGKIKSRREEEQKRLHEQARKEKEARLGLYRQRIGGWAEKGYSTKRLEGLLDDPDSDSITIEKRLAEFEGDIQKLLEVRRNLEPLRTEATEAELRELEKMLLDPDSIPAAQARLDEMARRFYLKKSEQEKRRELSGRLEAYRQKGYRVGRLEGAVGRPLEEAEPAFQSYERDVGSLFVLWDRLRALNRSFFPDDWEAARAQMNDPDRVPEVHKGVEALEARQVEMLARQADEDRKLLLTAKKYIGGIFERMRSGTPDYLPPGLYMKDARWEPHLAPDGMYAKGEVRSGLFSKESGVVACGFAPSLARQGVLSEAEAARSSSQFVAHCYVMTRAPAELLPFASSFSHPNLSFFIHDLSAGALLFNEQDLKTKVYSEWFAADAKPAGMKGAVKAVSDKHGIFTRAVLQARLGLPPKEIDEMLRGWMAKNEIVQVSKIRDEYSFMD